MEFYAVRRGRMTGIFESWDACRAQVHHFPGAEYKAFPNREEAEAFLSSRLISQPIKKKKRVTTSPSIIEIWVDGSCFPQGDGSLRLGWGLLVKKNGVEIHRDKGNDIRQAAMNHRNVAGEILAIIKAIHETGFDGFVAQEFIPTYEDKIKALAEGINICNV